MYRTYGIRAMHMYRTYGIRAMHMYRTYGIRAMQELLPRSNCRGAIVEEQKPAMREMVVDRCPQFMPLTVNGSAAVYLIVIILAVGKMSVNDPIS